MISDPADLIRKEHMKIFTMFHGPSIGEPDFYGQITTTSAEVTPNGGLVRESPQNPLNSGLGIIVICPDF